jgi:hypothetical protein
VIAPMRYRAAYHEVRGSFSALTFPHPPRILNDETEHTNIERVSQMPEPKNAIELWYHRDGRSLVYAKGGTVFSLEPNIAAPANIGRSRAGLYLSTSEPGVRCHHFDEPHPFRMAHAFVKNVRAAENVVKRIDRAIGHEPESIAMALALVRDKVEPLLLVPDVFDYVASELAFRADKPDVEKLSRLMPNGRFRKLLETVEWLSPEVADAPIVPQEKVAA